MKSPMKRWIVAALAAASLVVAGDGLAARGSGGYGGGHGGNWSGGHGGHWSGGHGGHWSGGHWGGRHWGGWSFYLGVPLYAGWGWPYYSYYPYYGGYYGYYGYYGYPYYYGDTVVYREVERVPGQPQYESPAETTVIPQGGSAPARGPTYMNYCESAKAFFPKVTQCPEGWKFIPPT